MASAPQLTYLCLPPPCILEVAPLPGKSFPSSPTCHLHCSSEPPVHSPSLRQPWLLSPAEDRADCCLLGTPQFPSGNIFSKYKWRFDLLAFPGTLHCRLSEGKPLQVARAQDSRWKTRSYPPQDLTQIHPSEPQSIHLQKRCDNSKVPGLLGGLNATIYMNCNLQTAKPYRKSGEDSNIN